MSPNLGSGNVMVLGLGDGTVRLVDLRDQPHNEICSTPAHHKWTTSVSMSASAHLVASAYGSGVCALWDVRMAGAQWPATAAAQVHQRPAFGCCFWPQEDGLLMTWSSDSTLKLLGIAEATPRLLVERSFSPSMLYHCSFSPQADTMALAGGGPGNGDMSACLMPLSGLASAQQAPAAAPEVQLQPAGADQAQDSAINAIMGDY